MGQVDHRAMDADVVIFIVEAERDGHPRQHVEGGRVTHPQGLRHRHTIGEDRTAARSLVGDAVQELVARRQFLVRQVGVQRQRQRTYRRGCWGPACS
jgi:hypothetical protein